jgi:hypothetical protein
VSIKLSNLYRGAYLTELPFLPNSQRRESGVARSTRRQSPAQADVPTGTTRFFLAKAGANGTTPTLDRECGSEGEAKIESLKTGLNYYSIVEWRATADFTGKNPQVRSEPVKR